MEFAKSYSQNKEDLIILDYFKGEKGTLLSVGENDGKTFSNAKLLIDNGWYAYLIEPSSVFEELESLHNGNDNVKCFNFGLGDKSGVVEFYESDNHVPNGDDKALVSSINYQDTVRWRKSGVNFTKKIIEIKTFDDFHESVGRPELDYISIDCEGFDFQILKQIHLSVVRCKTLIIEWNGNKELKTKFTDYCNKSGLKQIHQNAENLIFAK